MKIDSRIVEKVLIVIEIAALITFIALAAYKEETNTKSYPVVSVREYTRTETNRYGGVEDVEICYAINYIDADGNVQTNDTFQNLPNVGRKLTRGDSDLYIIYPDNTEVLQLTDDTFAKLTGTN